MTLYTADEGAAIDGKVIRDLPSSALDKLHAGAATQRVQTYRAIARTDVEGEPRHQRQAVDPGEDRRQPAARVDGLSRRLAPW